MWQTQFTCLHATANVYQLSGIENSNHFFLIIIVKDYNSQGINRFVIIDNDIWAAMCPPADCLQGDMWGIWDSKDTVCQLDGQLINKVLLTFIDRFNPNASHFIPNNDHVHLISYIWWPCDLDSSLLFVLEPGPCLNIKTVFPGIRFISWKYNGHETVFSL